MWSIRWLALAVGVTLISCGRQSPTGPSSPYQVGPTGNFRTIRDAIQAAPPDAVIEVFPGTYSENVVIAKQGIKLRGERAVLDGRAGGAAGTGIGILVSRTSNVEISGFTVQNFERGIVLDSASNCVVRTNELRNNTAKSQPPFTAGVTPFEGIVLLAAQNSEVSDNFVHDNGHDGLMVTSGSSGNTLRANRVFDNGAQFAPNG